MGSRQPWWSRYDAAKYGVSIQPLFTWEVIMEPGKVEELMRTLALLAKEAKTMGEQPEWI